MDPAPRRRLAALVRHARPERAASSSPLDALCAELGITEGVKTRLLEKHSGDAAKVMTLIQEVIDDLDADAAELEAATAVGVGVPGGVDVAGLPILDHSGDATLLGNATLEESYDFVVCGAGSAGAIVASRLSENPKWQVLLVEAGAEDRMAAMEMPAAVAALQRGQADWAYETEPMEGAALGAMPPTGSHRPLCLSACGCLECACCLCVLTMPCCSASAAMTGGRAKWPRGKALGGSSQLNYMLYVRGHPEDYDSWAALTQDEGWSYENVLPAFMKSQSLAEGSLKHPLDSGFHGEDGPVTVTHPAASGSSALAEAMLAAGRETGLPELATNPDYNGRSQTGMSVTQRNIGTDGRRQSTSHSFLTEARQRPNCHVLTGAHVARVIIEDGTAKGVEVVGADGKSANDLHYCCGRVVVNRTHWC